MGDTTIKPQVAAPPQGVQAPPPSAKPVAAPAADPKVAAASSAPTDQAAVAKTGAAATSVSLGEPAAAATTEAVQGPAVGPFEYSDKAMSLFNEFAASGKIHSGRIPVLDKGQADSFARSLLSQLARSGGGDPSKVDAELSKADAVKTLQSIVGARTDGRFGPETLYKTLQLVQTLVQNSTSVEKLLKAQPLIASFGGKVRGLDDMLAAQTLRVGEQMINGATTLDQLKQTEAQLAPLTANNPTLSNMIASKRSGLEASAAAAAAQAQAAAEAERANQATAAAAAAKTAQTAAEAGQKAAEAKTEATRVGERQGAINVALKDTKGTSKGDDVSRTLVAEHYNVDATDKQRATMIREMLDGFTGDDDEKAIIQILKDDIASGRINETLAALGPKDCNWMFDDIDGSENDALLKVIFTAPNISKGHLTRFADHIRGEDDSKLVDLANGKRGQLSETAAHVVLGQLLKSSPSGKDEGVRKLTKQIGMEGMIAAKVDLSRVYGSMGKDKQKAEFVVDILKGADAIQGKINAARSGGGSAEDIASLIKQREFALAQTKSALANADDDQTVEFMKLMIGDAKAPHSLKSFAQLPDPILSQLHKNLDSFWNNTWKTDTEKTYRGIISDAQAVKRREAFGNDGDSSAAPGSVAAGGDSATPAATPAPKAEAVAATTTGTPAPTVNPAPSNPPAAVAKPAAETVPGAAAATASKKSPNND